MGSVDSPLKSSQQHVQVCNKNQVQVLRYNRHGLKHIFSNLIDNATSFALTGISQSRNRVRG
jgi:hypothetical protein